MKAAVVALGVAALASPFIGMAAAQAVPAPHTVYVAQHARSSAADKSCSSPAFDSIQRALEALSTGGRVVVCDGTFHEDVAVTRSVTIEGRAKATIDATDLVNGIKITAPHVTVAGLTVENAIGEGILVQNADHAVIRGNTVRSNDTGVRLKDPVPTDYMFCKGQVGADCGENIHLVGSSHAVVRDNTVTDGSGGILLSDETGPTSHNEIIGNTVTDNHTACGIVLAGHNGKAAPGGKPDPAAGGVFDNTVEGNVVTGNGLQATGGAGVQMATALPGGAVYGNTVTHNSISGNGHSGVTIHSHQAGQYLDGNVITDNRIGVNNLNGDTDFAAKDTEKTGILVGTVSPLSVRIRGNAIADDHFGVFTIGPVTAAGERDNSFSHVAVPVSTN